MELLVALAAVAAVAESSAVDVMAVADLQAAMAAADLLLVALSAAQSLQVADAMVAAELLFLHRFNQASSQHLDSLTLFHLLQHNQQLVEVQARTSHQWLILQPSFFADSENSVLTS